MAYDDILRKALKDQVQGTTLLHFCFGGAGCGKTLSHVQILWFFPSFMLRKSISSTETDTVLLYI